MAELDDRDLYSGLIRLHVLHHASEEPVFGLGMVQELARRLKVPYVILPAPDARNAANVLQMANAL